MVNDTYHCKNTQCKYILSANLSAISEKAIACEFLQCIIAKRTDRFYFSLNGINYLQTKMKRKANLDMYPFYFHEISK